MAVVAQLVRALVCGAGGRGFEPHHPPLIFKAVLKRAAFFFAFFADCGVALSVNGCTFGISIINFFPLFRLYAELSHMYFVCDHALDADRSQADAYARMRWCTQL